MLKYVFLSRAQHRFLLPLRSWIWLYHQKKHVFSLLLVYNIPVIMTLHAIGKIAPDGPYDIIYCCSLCRAHHPCCSVPVVAFHARSIWMTPSPATRRRWQRRLLEDALTDPLCDAVWVAGPTPLHKECIRMAAEAGKVRWVRGIIDVFGCLTLSGCTFFQ